MSETGPTSTADPAADFDAIVIGAGHNGLVTAAYLARAGVRTLLLEARADVGGTAASESFAGATVNICNCDHLTFRTTPVIDELGLVGPRARVHRRRAGPAQLLVGERRRRSRMVAPPRPRRHARRPRRRLSRPGRRVSPLRQGGDAGGTHGARRGRRTADGRRSHEAGTAAPAPRRAHPACGGPAAAPPTSCDRSSTTTR